jgi:hypothetical protein
MPVLECRNSGVGNTDGTAWKEREDNGASLISNRDRSITRYGAESRRYNGGRWQIADMSHKRTSLWTLLGCENGPRQVSTSIVTRY